MHSPVQLKYFWHIFYECKSLLSLLPTKTKSFLWLVRTVWSVRHLLYKMENHLNWLFCIILTFAILALFIKIKAWINSEPKQFVENVFILLWSSERVKKQESTFFEYFRKKNIGPSCLCDVREAKPQHFFFFFFSLLSFFS